MNPNRFIYHKMNCIHKSCASFGKTKVFLVEKKIAPPNIYHVSLEFKRNDTLYITETAKQFHLQIKSSDTIIHSLPDINKSIYEIKAYETKLQEEPYILGFNDCRHYCNKMLDILYNVDDEMCMLIKDIDT